MARTTIKITCSNIQMVNRKIEMILLSHKYRLINENGEKVWKRGVGFWTAMKYIKVEFSMNNTVVLYGWIRPFAGSEQDLNGVVGAIPKKKVMNVIREIQNAIL